MPNIGDIIRADDINDIKSSGYIGQIISYSSNLIPSNVLICDGAEISRDTYSELFTVINTIYGEGDGTTTFNIPDLRDKWIKYSGSENIIGDILEEGLPNITGSITSMQLNITGAFFTGDKTLSCTNTTQGNTFCVAKLDASRSSAIYGNSTHVTPNSIVLLPCIVFE